MTEADARAEYGDALVDRALARRASYTQYGWRVAYDPLLDGDYEDRVTDGHPRAYWPKQSWDGRRWFCRCRHGRSRRMCSHVLAVKLQL